MSKDEMPTIWISVFWPKLRLHLLITSLRNIVILASCTRNLVKFGAIFRAYHKLISNGDSGFL
jgi:hypothetical protein